LTSEHWGKAGVQSLQFLLPADYLAGGRVIAKENAIFDKMPSFYVES